MEYLPHRIWCVCHFHSVIYYTNGVVSTLHFLQWGVTHSGYPCPLAEGTRTEFLSISYTYTQNWQFFWGRVLLWFKLLNWTLRGRNLFATLRATLAPKRATSAIDVYLLEQRLYSYIYSTRQSKVENFLVRLCFPLGYNNNII